MSLLSIYNIIFAFLVVLGFSSMKTQGGKKVPETYISYKLLENGDTINIIDADSLKQGKWFEDYYLDKYYYYELGYYLDGMKEGEWKTYSNGDALLEISQYHDGVKNGPSVQFANRHILSMGFYKGGYYKKGVDTIWVDNPEDDKAYQVGITYDPYSVRDSVWYFFNEFTGDTLSRITYYYGNVLETVDYQKQYSEEINADIIKKLPHNQDKILQINKKPRKPYFPQK